VTTDTTGVTRERRSRRPRLRDAHDGSALPPIATEMVSPEKWCRGDAQSLDRSGAERIVEPRAPTGHSQHNRSNHCRRRRLCPCGAHPSFIRTPMTTAARKPSTGRFTRASSSESGPRWKFQFTRLQAAQSQAAPERRLLQQDIGSVDGQGRGEAAATYRHYGNFT